MKKLFILIVILFVWNSIYSQQRLIMGINPLRGRSIEFKFHTLSDIANGKSLGTAGIGYTEVYIYLDTIGDKGNYYLPQVTGWELVAYANTPTIEADFGSTDMSLNEVQLRCTMTKGTGSIVAVSTLTANPNNVIASGNIGNGDPAGKSRVNPAGFLEWTVTIAFDCGTTSGLGSYKPDLYYTDFILFIRPIYA